MATEAKTGVPKIPASSDISQGRPKIAIPPGLMLKDELEARGMSQRRLAAEMKRPLHVINEIALGKRALTPRTAVELEMVLEIPAHVWVGLEGRYRLALELGYPTAPIDEVTPLTDDTSES